jgi:two-component system nitrogen regulation sensor histidine kinase GlnL
MDSPIVYQFSTDDKLRIISWGEKVAELTGKPPAEVLGRKYSEVFPMIVKKDEDAIGTVLKRKRRITMEGHNFGCLFGQMKADISIRPIIKNAKVKAIEVTVVPDSSCPMAERLRELQRFVDIGKIASTLAHGVRNPLNAIKGAVVYLRDKYPKEPPLVEFTRIIEYEIHRLDTFISRFLSTSVSESELNETDINALMERIKVVTSFQAQSSDINVIYELGDVPPIKANAFQIEQAVLNVMNNALRAMSSGGQLRVRTLVEKGEGINSAVIEVSDTGPGISNSPVGVVNPKNSDGKGFGLFITHEILKCHGGHLEVNSKKGEGTTMRLHLPVA